MMDLNAIQTRLKWAELHLTDVLAWALDPELDAGSAIFKHASDTVNALQKEISVLKREYKLAESLNKRVKR